LNSNEIGAPEGCADFLCASAGQSREIFGKRQKAGRGWHHHSRALHRRSMGQGDNRLRGIRTGPRIGSGRSQNILRRFGTRLIDSGFENPAVAAALLGGSPWGDGRRRAQHATDIQDDFIQGNFRCDRGNADIRRGAVGVGPRSLRCIAGFRGAGRNRHQPCRQGRQGCGRCNIAGADADDLAATQWSIGYVGAGPDADGAGGPSLLFVDRSG
jgi:hypothetical protein